MLRFYNMQRYLHLSALKIPIGSSAGARRPTRLLRKGWLESIAELSSMKTVPIEQAVQQTNATKVLTYGGLKEEHRAAEDLCHYSQGLTEKFCQEVPVRRLKITIVFRRK